MILILKKNSVPKQISFAVLGKPISNNLMWIRNIHGGMSLSAEARRWKNQVSWAAHTARRMEQPGFDCAKGKFSVETTYYFGDKRRRDAHNMDKLVFDAMEGIFYSNDQQIVEWSGKKEMGEWRVEIVVTQLEQ